jgi:very-short-patch-repair endonuclease
MSDAEQGLWNVLRGRQVSDLKFCRQHPFGNYILDFVCLENKRVIEVDGGQHGEQTGYDENRTQELEAAGFYVLRFWNKEVLKEIESVREKIGLVVQELQSHPPPDLPLEGGGVKKVAPLIFSLPFALRRRLAPRARGGLGWGWGKRKGERAKLALILSGERVRGI